LVLVLAGAAVCVQKIKIWLYLTLKYVRLQILGGKKIPNVRQYFCRTRNKKTAGARTFFVAFDKTTAIKPLTGIYVGD
jgi:hypothetical protein